jgi:hypothetical protein
MTENWSPIEVDHIIADYFSMLTDELFGRTINKTEHRRKLISLLNNRTPASIEYKHRNISAALRKQGLPSIKGYLPANNYQKLLLDKKISEYLEREKETLISVFELFAENIEFHPKQVDFSKIESGPPAIVVAKEPKEMYARKPIKTNYLEREQMNSLLGLKGEELAIEYEKWRLIEEKRESFINDIKWISKEDDGAGFDILSKNKNGSDRYIEMKTTKLDKETPFFFSRNEFDFAKEKTTAYHLYRIYDFAQKPQLFMLNGEYDSICQKEITQYKGFF